MQWQNTISDLSCLGLLKISGENAQKFLQGQLTCNLDEVTENQTRLGAHCNPQGRIISLFRIFLYQDSYYLQMPRDMVPIALNALQKYAVFFKITLIDASETLKKIGYCGDQLGSIPDTDDGQLIINDLIIIKVPGSVSRYEIIGTPETVESLQMSLYAPLENNWKYLDIISGQPAIYPQTSEKFLPHDINLPNLGGVSFNKGCYTGQEIIARMHYRAKLKTSVYSAKVSIPTESAPQYGADLYSGNKPCGNIIDYCQFSYNSYELLITASEKELWLDEQNTIKIEITG